MDPRFISSLHSYLVSWLRILHLPYRRLHAAFRRLARGGSRRLWSLLSWLTEKALRGKSSKSTECSERIKESEEITYSVGVVASRIPATLPSILALAAELRSTDAQDSKESATSSATSTIDEGMATCVQTPDTGDTKFRADENSSAMNQEPSTRAVAIVPVNKDVFPISSVRRYDKGITIPQDERGYVINAMTMHFPLEDAPSDWEPCTHPEGSLYWVHRERRIYTDAFLCDVNLYTEIMTFLKLLDNMRNARGIVLLPDDELVLELEPRYSGDGHYWCYYYVRHSDRTLFWLHDYDFSADISELKAVSSAAHIKHELDAKYWLHWEMFPQGHKLAQRAIRELTGILIHAAADRSTSPVSTFGYSVEDLRGFLELLDRIQADDNSDHANCVVGRLMNLFAHHRFLNFYGQPYARLCHGQRVYSRSFGQRTALIGILSPLLFYAPNVHMTSLQEVWIDDILSYPHWVTYTTRLSNEWQSLLTPATVLLDASIAFLAIPSVDNGQHPQRSAAQILSYISIVASIGSMVLSLLLARQYGATTHKNAEEVVAFLTKNNNPIIRMEALAIIYSLPYATMMWALIAFLISFSMECFLKGDPLSTYPTAVAWIVMAALISWCIATLGGHPGDSIVNILKFCKQIPSGILGVVHRAIPDHPGLRTSSAAGREHADERHDVEMQTPGSGS